MARTAAASSTPRVVLSAGTHAGTGSTRSVAHSSTTDCVCSFCVAALVTPLGDLRGGHAVVVEGLHCVTLAHEAATCHVHSSFYVGVSPVHIPYAWTGVRRGTADAELPSCAGVGGVVAHGTPAAVPARDGSGGTLGTGRVSEGVVLRVAGVASAVCVEGGPCGGGGRVYRTLDSWLAHANVGAVFVRWAWDGGCHSPIGTVASHWTVCWETLFVPPLETPWGANDLIHGSGRAVVPTRAGPACISEENRPDVFACVPPSITGHPVYARCTGPIRFIRAHWTWCARVSCVSSPAVVDTHTALFIVVEVTCP